MTIEVTIDQELATATTFSWTSLNPMNKWPHSVKPMTAEEIQQFVDDPDWQTIRLGMKGMSTNDKLKILSAYRYNRLAFNSGDGTCRNRNPADQGILERPHEVQIDNYINALKRGGFLNDQLEVIK